jgi:integrase
MARMEAVQFQNYAFRIDADRVVWSLEGSVDKVPSLPQIFWKDRGPWREANLWAHERAVEHHKDRSTVLAELTGLYQYAKWLEENNIDWMYFPEKKKERGIFRYRGFLIDGRDKGALAPSTVAERMRVVICFYRWAKANGILSVAWPLWRDKTARFTRPNAFGMERSFAVLSSELSIPNRVTRSDSPEDGLMPVSSIDRNLFLRFARENTSEEIFLLLSLGFFTGMRLGSIVDLKVNTIANALPDPRCNDLFRLELGPGARPPVATKFGVTGHVYIPKSLLDHIREYADGTRRLLREAKALPNDRDLVFLTKYGNPYAQRGVDKSVAVNVAMHSLRKRATAAGIKIAREFWFHQTRATFGTELARMALKFGDPKDAISIVKDALLHRNEESAMHYIRFVEKTPIKVEMANEFTRSFLGAFRVEEKAHE